MSKTLLAPILILGAAPPTLDVLPPGSKAVSGSVHVELAPEARARAIVGYSVRAGDTLEQIAEAELGSTGRSAEITALNPDLEPTKLPPDGVIWLPPTDPGAEDAVYLFARTGLGWGVSPVVPGAEIHDHYGVTLVAVPRARIAEFEALASSQEPAQMDTLSSAEWIATSKLGSRPRSVAISDPTARIVDRFRVTTITAGKPEAELVEEVFYDEQGRRLAPWRVHLTRILLLALLASLGGAGLWLVAVRRRRAPRRDPDRAAEVDAA